MILSCEPFSVVDTLDRPRMLMPNIEEGIDTTIPTFRRFIRRPPGKICGRVYIHDSGILTKMMDVVGESLDFTARESVEELEFRGLVLSVTPVLWQSTPDIWLADISIRLLTPLICKVISL
jgi:hypothetical protein